MGVGVGWERGGGGSVEEGVGGSALAEDNKAKIFMLRNK